MYISFIFLLSVIISIITIKAVIKIAKIKKLFDDPSENRKIHILKTPNLGGIGIYFSFIFVTSLLIKNATISYYNSLIAASILIFAIGLKDDLIPISPSKKFIAQILSAIIMAYFGDIRITSFYGILGLYELSYPLSIIFTIIISVFIYNALNLIDGIDGLAGGIGILSSLTFSFLFYKLNSFNDVFISIAFAGSLIGFMFFNIPNAKTFMGDSGSLIIGFVLSIFSIRFCELNEINGSGYKSAAALSFSILILPLFDTLRVFILRIISGNSPFIADSNHIHHRLIKMGFNHLQVTSILLSINIFLIYIAISFQSIGNLQLFITLFLTMLLINLFLWNLSKI
jgi:UDP-GlcNAc:undecaprenyl-phosphate GlcNAc-1-phosphate transferase